MIYYTIRTGPNSYVRGSLVQHHGNEATINVLGRIMRGAIVPLYTISDDRPDYPMTRPGDVIHDC